jgi:hypothetical protein
MSTGVSRKNGNETISNSISYDMGADGKTTMEVPMQRTGIQTLGKQRSMVITKQRMRFVIREESMIRVQDCII